MRLYVQGREILRVDATTMLGILSNPDLPEIAAYPVYWAIIDNELVVWPKPAAGVEISVLFT